MNVRSIRFRLTIWYVGLLATLILLFGASVYVGLGQYLKNTLSDSLTKEAQQIGETLLVNVTLSGEGYVVDELKEHFDPEVNGLFVRVTRAEGGTLYESGLPRDGSFNPADVTKTPSGLVQRDLRIQRLPGGGSLMIATLPFTARDGAKFLIELGKPMTEIERVLHGLLLTFVLGLPLVLVIAAAGGYILTRKALSPVGEITRTAEQITSHNLSDRLATATTGDELETLSLALNRMIARIEHAFRHMNRFAGDASHELRTPLTIIRGELESVAQRSDLPVDARETVSSALEETERLSRIVESLLAISRLDAGEAVAARERFDLADLVSSTAEQMRLMAEDKKISLQCNAVAAAPVEGDRGRIKQVIVNLLDNAFKYTPEGGAVTVSVDRVDSSALLEVADTGIGIPADAAPHVFERFYRVDKARSRKLGGSGLGLSIVKSICAAHGGQVTVQSKEGAGSLFRVRLPLANGSLE